MSELLVTQLHQGEGRNERRDQSGTEENKRQSVEADGEHANKTRTGEHHNCENLQEQREPQPPAVIHMRTVAGNPDGRVQDVMSLRSKRSTAIAIKMAKAMRL